MGIKGILFDKDGTIIEFEKTWHRVFENIFLYLEKELNLEKYIIDELKLISGFNEMGFEKESLIQYSTLENIINTWMKVLDKDKLVSRDELKKILEYHGDINNIKIFPIGNVKGTFKSLKSKGIFIGIATADTEKPTIDSLVDLNIYKYVDFIGSDNGFFENKPSIHMAEEFMNKYQLLPDEVLMVGDSVNDMRFAENSNINFIGVKGKFNNYQEFIKSGYEVINSIEEIESLI